MTYLLGLFAFLAIIALLTAGNSTGDTNKFVIRFLLVLLILIIGVIALTMFGVTN